MANDAINLEIYGQIMRTRVFPFIQNQYRDSSYYFWHGLAFAHGILDGLQVLQSNSIWFIAKKMNPLAVVLLNPIKDHCGALKKAAHNAE